MLGQDTMESLEIWLCHAAAREGDAERRYTVLSSMVARSASTSSVRPFNTYLFAQ